VTLAAASVTLAVGPVEPSLAGVARSDSFKAVKVAHPPTFDAALSDQAWKQGVVATDFVDYTSRKPGRFATTAYLVYDAQNIYVAFRSVQPGVPFIATQATNNVGFGLDDWVAAGFDITGNGTREYQFFVTPRGTRYQQSTESSRFNPPWQARSTVEGDVWTAELIIPFRDLKTSSGKVQSWRFNFGRQVVSTNETFTWSFDPRMGGAGDSTYWPSLTDIQLGGARPQPYADVYGLVSAGRDRNRFERPNLGFAQTTIRNYGVDVDYPLTNSLAFVGTLAPDFSNVEIDQQIIAPQEFQRQLTEYRSFFAQGANYLSPGLGDTISGGTFASLFYSPNIGIFNRGVKIEGTQGLNALGVLEAAGNGFDDVAYGYDHRGADQSFRYFVDGVIANHTGVRDASYQFGGRKTNLVSGIETGFEYAGETGTLAPDPSLAHYYDVYASVGKPNYAGFAGYHSLGPFFAPLDGFTPIDDVRGPFAFVNTNGAGRGNGTVQSYNVFAGGERYLDWGGNVHAEDVQTGGNVAFKDLVSVNVFSEIGTLRTYPDDGPGYPSYAHAAIFPFDTAQLALSYRANTSTPVTASYMWGAFATLCPSGPPAPSFCSTPTFSNFVNTYNHQFTTFASRPVGSRSTVALEYDGTYERPFSPAAVDSQFLRRVTLGESLGEESNVSVSLRSITGIGGFAAPGVNLAVSYHKQFANGNELFVAFGTPAATTTLDRLIVKYVQHFGGGAGT